MRSSWARWLRSLSRPQTKTIRKNRAAEYYLRLEPLEDRLAPATLPVPVITSPASPLPTSFGSPQGDHPLSDAQIVVDPRNAQHLVAVASYNPINQPTGSNIPDTAANIPGYRFWFSTNAGASWTLGSAVNNLRDPSLFVTDAPDNTQAFYSVNEGANVAYDTFGNFYVVTTQHNAGDTSGALTLHKFNFSGNSASLVDLDPNTTGTNGQVLYRWLNQDPAYNPVVAIDTNVPSFTDPASGITQTDSMAATFSRAFTTVNSAALVAPGSGYTPGDVLTIRGTSNSPAQLRVNTVQAVDPVVVTAGGTGYVVGNILDVQGGTFTTRAQLRVAEVGASAAAIVGAGTGYTVNDILTVVGGVFSTPTQIQVTTVGGTGDITGIAVLTPGSYSTIPTNAVSVTGGTGTGATFNMTYGVVTAATVQTPGSYTNVPFNSVTVTGGAGTGATFDLTYGVLGSTLTSPGTYLGTLPNPAPVVGGTGLGATFNVTYTQPGIVTGGTGYAPNDVLTVQGGVFTGPARIRVTQVGAAPTTAVATGGTGYAVGNILTVQGGVFTTRAQLRVAAIGTGGVITAVTVQTPGTYFTAPGNAVSVTGGAGTGATFNLDFSVVTGATIADSGAYNTLPSNPVSVTGGGGTGATFNLATLGGTPKGIYVAWNTLFTQPQFSTPATLSRIWTRASGDGGLNFSTTQFISTGGVPAAAPQIVFTQGSADGRVAGGRMLVFWSGSLAEPANPLVFNRIVMDASAPDGGVATAGAVASKTFTGGRQFINDAFAPQNTPPNNIVRPTNARLGVDIIDPTFTTLNDLDVTVNIRHPTMAELRITLVAPNGTSVPLLLSGFNPFDSAAITGQGIVGANLGTLIGGTIGTATDVYTHDVNTVFDDQAQRSIRDGAPATAWAGHYRPEGGSLSVFNGLTAAQLAGVWTLRIEDTIASGQTPPPQFLDSWSLTFTSIINTTGFGSDTSLPLPFTDASNRPMTTVQGSVTGTSNPLVNAASGPAGVGPGIRVAVDNTLGSFSPNQGNIYVVYTGYRSRTALTDNANDTDIMMMRSTNGGASWSSQIRVNNDTANDNFSEGTRPQYNPAAAVDLLTGTLVLTWFDARWDAARARVSTFITTSIDGGSTFSAQTYLNQAKTAIDAVTRNTVTIEPIPGNPSVAAAGALGFGTRQGLAVNAGHVYSAFASNFNGTVNAGNIAEPLSRVFFAQATIAAGPRIISGDMGPITSGSFTSDGTPRLTGFQIVFDRPVDPATFTDDDVTMEYRDTVTLASDPATLILLPGRGSFNVVPQNLGAFGATIFLVQLTAPLSGVGTYSYAIGPNISDRIRNRSSVGVSGGNSPISQFASTVIGFSTEFSTTSWSAAQTLGAPDTQYGDNPTAWSALNADGPPNPEFVSVGYDTPVFATGVVVRESNVNGFVTQIDLIDVNDVLHTVFTGPDTSATGQLADLTVNFPATPYLVKGVKVTVDPLKSLGEWEEIDAVTLIGHLIFPASGAEINLPVPPTGTGGTVGGIVFPTPPATNADTTNSAITVSGLTGPVQDVNVSVQLAHTRNSDISMRLVAPSGQVILLTQRRGGTGNNGYIDVTFDDQASASVITATAPYAAVRPEGTLGVLNGMLPAVANGTWTLQVNDSVTGQTGTLLGWSISFNSPALGSVSNGGNLVDQNQDTVTGDYPSDVFAIPNPINGQPFQLPYTKDTLPLIITGPRLVDTSVAANPANINQANNTVVNGNNGSIDLTFDRDIKADSFTTANILRLMGPVGPITNYIAPPTVVFTGGGGTGAAGVVVLGPGGQIVGVQITNAGSGYISPPLVSFVSDHGAGAAATASVAGGKLTNVAIANGGLNYGIPTLTIPDTGTVSSSFKVDDSLQVNDLSVSVQLTHPRMADLTVVLVAPDGSKVQLFDGGTGTGFNNTIFDFFAPTPITAGGGTYNGTFRPVPGVDTAVVVSGGAGYKVGDMLTVQGGTFGSQATLRVLTIAPGGAIGTVQVVRPGMYTVLPTTPASVVSTTGTGSGATFSLTLGATLKSLNLKNYLSDLDPLTPLGTWTLQVTDWATGSSGGALRGWSLNPFTVTPQGDFRATPRRSPPAGPAAATRPATSSPCRAPARRPAARRLRGQLGRDHRHRPRLGRPVPRPVDQPRVGDRRGRHRGAVQPGVRHPHVPRRPADAVAQRHLLVHLRVRLGRQLHH
ncbi:MAG: proprotein convertase P-domain-containing protein [Gemmataceae bacterium]